MSSMKRYREMDQAIIEDDIEKLAALISEGMNPNGMLAAIGLTPSSSTVLRACESGSSEAVRLLLKSGATPGTEDVKKGLRWLASQEKKEAFEDLLRFAKKIEVDLRSLSFVLASESDSFWLESIIKKDHLSMDDDLLGELLFRAAEADALSNASLLMRMGANPRKKIKNAAPIDFAGPRVLDFFKASEEREIMDAASKVAFKKTQRSKL